MHIFLRKGELLSKFSKIKTHTDFENQILRFSEADKSCFYH